MANSTRTTVIGVFADEKTAQSVINEIVNAGIPRSDVQLGSNADFAAKAASGGAGLTGRAPEQEQGGFMHWLESLFGGESSADDRQTYSDAARRGNCVVGVNTQEENADRIGEIMERNGALDVDETSETYRSDVAAGADKNVQALKGARAGDAQPGNVLPVVEEEIQVGKRSVERGGVRVYTRSVERPVEENITLHEERVRIERRPVNRAATAADLNALRDQTFEVTETVEEPVVSKRARVVEEVLVGKETSERTETVRGTVRNQTVEVEEIAGKGGTAGRAAQDYTADYRRDYDTEYAASGTAYATYAPAYDFGSRMASDSRFQGKGFTDVEQTLKTDYLRANPNSSWDRMRGAVRYGWERATGKR